MNFKKIKIVPANANLQALDIDDVVSGGLIIHECGITVESGASILGGDLTVSGTTTLNGNLLVNGNLFVSGCSNFKDISVDGTATFKGDLLFTGNSAGLVFGSMYGNEIAYAVAGAVQNTWYDVTEANIANSVVPNKMSTNTGEITTVVSGIYQISFFVTLEASIANKHLQAAASINNTATLESTSHLYQVTANEEVTMCGSTILSLNKNAVIAICVRTTDAGAPNLTVTHMSLSVVMVGGN